jgi:hypothetical protein
MGLDMNLYRKSYVKNWEHEPKSEQSEVIVKKGGVVRSDIKSERVAYVIEDVAYWRKANAIHNWIVKNCAGGVDKCQQISMSDTDLKNLLNAVNTVLASSKLVEGTITNGQRYENGKWVNIEEKGKTVESPVVADLFLPTASGFFFGGTDYDEYYIKDLEYTKSVLEPIVAGLATDGGRYYYQASW